MSKYVICPSCDGEGSYVNPAVDSQGLSAEDLADDDFREDYLGGVYDQRCSECRGLRVVAGCLNPACDEPAQAAVIDSEFPEDHRGRNGALHYTACYEHLDADQREWVDEQRAHLAEVAAERRAGA